jgi:hypothetical protein
MHSDPRIRMRARHTEVGTARVQAAARHCRAHGRVRALGAAALVLLASAPALGDTPEFSAEAVYATAPGVKQPPPTSSAKLYVGKEKLRIDFAGFVGHSLIVDEAAHRIVALLPDRKAYQPLESRPAEYFRIADAEGACLAWQRAIGTPIRCEKSGPELVAGRKTVRYTRATGGGSIDEIWVDPTLQFAVKWRIDGIEVALRDIREGAQPADRFLVPDGYGPIGPSKRPFRPKRRP